MHYRVGAFYRSEDSKAIIIQVHDRKEAEDDESTKSKFLEEWFDFYALDKKPEEYDLYVDEVQIKELIEKEQRMLRKRLLLMRILSTAFKNYEETADEIPPRAEKVCFRDCYIVPIVNPSFISARQRVSMKTKNFIGTPLTRKIAALALFSPSVYCIFLLPSVSIGRFPFNK